MSELGNVNPLSAESMQHVAMSSAERSAGQAPSVGEALSEGEAPYGAACCDTKDNVTRIRPVIPKNDDIWNMLLKKSEVYTEEQKRKAWTDAAVMVQDYSDDMIARWNKEIDTYLVFAGLFSAILTAFNVQSYLLLQPAAPDPSVAILQQISSQLASYLAHLPFINSTQPSSSGSANVPTPPTVPRWTVWLNTLWFSSLILSLTSASVGIMVKQWLNEYSGGISGTSRPVARVRQYRLSNLRTWHVEDVVGIIPTLLQLALALFLAGILILLWNLHSTVAAIASTLVGLLGVFTVTATLLPLVNHRCAYLTPQIRALDSLWQPKRYAYWICTSISTWRNTAKWFLGATVQMLCTFRRRIGLYVSLTYWESLWRTAWDVVQRLMKMSSPPESWRDRKQTWQGRERSAIDELTSELDKQTIVEAYSSTLHPDALFLATVCLMDFQPADVVDYFRRLHKSAREHFGPVADAEIGPLGNGNQQRPLWLHIILCALWENASPLPDDEAVALGVYFKHGSWPSRMQADDAGWAVSTCNAITDRLESSWSSSETMFIDQESLQTGQRYLFENAMRREMPLVNVLLLGVTRTYREVRLKQSRITEASSYDLEAALTEYLRSVTHFLERANPALKQPFPSDDLETIHTYIWDVLAELTHTLLDLFAEDKVRRTIESKYLFHVMWELQSFDDARVEECIPDYLLPDILHLVDILATASDYNEWRWAERIQEHARAFKESIIRVKCKPDTTGYPDTSPAEPSASRP